MDLSNYNWNSVKFIDVFRVIGSPAGTRFFAHGRCDIYQLGLKMYGSSEIMYNRRKYIFDDESILYLPKEASPNIDYRTTILNQGESLCIFFDSDNPLPPAPILKRHTDAHLRGMFLELHKFYNRNNRDLFACMSIFFKILSCLNSKSSDSNASKASRLDNVLAYMHEHISDSYIDFDMLAAENEISIDRFRHIFKSEYDCSTLQYFHQLKTEYIKTLIHNSAYSLSNIAAMSGFNDFNYFSRFFKKHVGISPSEYKKMHLL